MRTAVGLRDGEIAQDGTVQRSNELGLLDRLRVGDAGTSDVVRIAAPSAGGRRESAWVPSAPWRSCAASFVQVVPAVPS